MCLVHQCKVAAASVPPQERVKEFAGEHLALRVEREAIISVPAEKSVFTSNFLHCIQSVFNYDVLFPYCDWA